MVRPATLEYVTDDLVFDSLDAGNRGEVSLVVGVVRDEVFVPLEDGQDLPILLPFKGAMDPRSAACDRRA